MLLIIWSTRFSLHDAALAGHKRWTGQGLPAFISMSAASPFENPVTSWRRIPGTLQDTAHIAPQTPSAALPTKDTQPISSSTRRDFKSFVWQLKYILSSLKKKKWDCLPNNGAWDSAPVPLCPSHYSSLSDPTEYRVAISRLFAKLFLFICAKLQTAVYILETAASCRSSIQPVVHVRKRQFCFHSRLRREICASTTWSTINSNMDYSRTLELNSSLCLRNLSAGTVEDLTKLLLTPSF